MTVNMTLPSNPINIDRESTCWTTYSDERGCKRSTFQVFVRFITGKEMAYDVCPQCTIKDLMAYFMNKEGVHTRHQHLVYKGAPISCDAYATLDTIGIKKQPSIWYYLANIKELLSEPGPDY